jgi:anti-sigma regulatory factor (Ser/Thr protein kinase)
MTDHLVKFYENEEELAATAVGFSRAGVLAGDAVMFVATPEHRKAFRGGLQDSGIDVGEAEAQGWLSMFDAAGMLEQLTDGGSLDPGAFDHTVGDLVRRAMSPGRSTRIYGEMVSLLWERGDLVGAMELEGMWNALGSATSFVLLCAYPCKLMESPEAIPAFCEVCGLHSEVLGGPPLLEDAEVVARFPCCAQAARYARRFVSDALCSWGCPQLVDDALQIVSELAINAISHARSSFTVSLARTPVTVRIAVGDADESVPELTTPSTTAERGRGLKLVEALSVRWEHSPAPGGKIVWADLELPRRR